MPDRKTILIVDDAAHVVRSLRFVLERAGYEVLEARDGEEALEVVRSADPDLLFLDIMLPQLEGYEVCRQIKASPDLASIPVVMLTAKSRQEERQAALSAGADEYITKPFSPGGVVELANSLLGTEG